MTYKGYIYIILNKKNGQMYIGQTVRDPKIRWQEHVRDSTSQIRHSVLSDAMIEYGIKNFDMSILEIIEEESKESLYERLNDRERMYIAKYKRDAYNVALGGAATENACGPEKMVNAFSDNGKWLATFRSAREAGRMLNIENCNINRCCNHLRQRAGDYAFEFADVLELEGENDGKTVNNNTGTGGVKALR